MNSVQAATTSGPPTAVIGLSLRSRAQKATSEATPDRDEHRHERQQRPDERAQPDRQEQEHEQDRQVGEQDAVGLEVVEQADADHGQARRGGSVPSGGSASSRMSFTTTARSSSEVGPVRKMRLSAVAVVGDRSTSGCPAGATSYAACTPPRRWAPRARPRGPRVRSATVLDDARAGEQLLRVRAPAARVVKSSTKSTTRLVEHALARLGLDEHAELGRAADLLLDVRGCP